MSVRGALREIFQGSIAVVALSGVAFLGYIDWKFQGNVRKSDSYKECMKILHGYQPAMEILGEPLRTKRLETAASKNSYDATNAKLTIPLRGSKDSGTLFGWSSKDDSGVWTVDRLDIQIASNETKWTFYKKNYNDGEL